MCVVESRCKVSSYHNEIDSYMPVWLVFAKSWYCMHIPGPCIPKILVASRGLFGMSVGSSS